MTLAALSWALAIANSAMAAAYHGGMQDEYNACLDQFEAAASAAAAAGVGTSNDFIGGCDLAAATLFRLEAASVCLTTLSAVLLALPVAAVGWRAALAESSGWRQADAAIVALTWLTSFCLLVGPSVWLADTRTPGVSDVLEVGRALRVLRIITLSGRFQALLETLADCGTLILQLLGVYCAVTYAYAVVGMQAFGDIPTSPALDARSFAAAAGAATAPNGTASSGQLAEDFITDQRYSFGTFEEASLVLFQITVGNNVSRRGVRRAGRWLRVSALLE